MTFSLESPFYRLNIQPGDSTWELLGKDQDSPQISRVRTSLRYRRGEAAIHTALQLAGSEITVARQENSSHGPLQQAILTIPNGPPGLRSRLVFALPERYPLLLWQLEIDNMGTEPVSFAQIELLAAERGNTCLQNLGAEPAFFANSWQSWSYSGSYSAGDRFRHTRLGPLREPNLVNAGTPSPWRRGHFAADMFGVLGSRVSRRGVLAGFLSQRQHFGSLATRLDLSKPTLRLWANGDGALLPPGERLSTDWACLQILDLQLPELGDPDALGPYLEAVAREHGLSGEFKPIPTGWCSWYQYSTEHYTGALTAEDIRRNIEAIASLQPGLPLEVVQIDDGFQAQIGDWLASAPGFPQGVQPLANEMRAAGFTPGLWLAPFIVHPRSRLAQEHPAWMLRGRFNRPVNSGFNWGTFTTALDLTHPAALDYVRQVIDTAAHRWGYSYLKLDFLYAGALPGRLHDPRLTRAQALRRGLEAIRQAAGEETFLLGCGCPLGSAIGLVDAMRIGADTGTHWRGHYRGVEFFFKNEMDIPAAAHALQNALSRAALHRRWWINDPDCLLLRRETRLTRHEVRTVATLIALTGGSLLLSDDLARLAPEELHIAQVLLPLIGERAQVLDWFERDRPEHLRLDLANATGEWHLLAWVNWADRAGDKTLVLADYGLPPEEHYWARPFWTSFDENDLLQARLIEDGQIHLQSVPPHATALFAVRNHTPGAPRYLGSDLHLSQGLEVTAWEPGEEGLRLRLARPGHAAGQIELYLPGAPRVCLQEGKSLPYLELGRGQYLFDVVIEGETELTMSFRTR